jgi:phospholipid/cholesterol/gamma-HCH transport system permease protein
LNYQSDPKTGDTVVMPRTITKEWVEGQKNSRVKPVKNLHLDFSNTQQIDSAGIAYIRVLHRFYNDAGKKIILVNITADHLSSLQESADAPVQPEKKSENSPFFKIGDRAVSFYSQIVESLSVLVEMLYWGTFGIFKRQDFKRGALGEQMYLLGYKAIGIVGLLSFLIGIVLSLQSAIQLRTYGAGIFLAPLIGITMVREMGPLLTAIILAGRTGSATTAEIATMGVNEEIDALRTMGINPIQFVVVPKFWAISLTMPILSIIATTAGIIGGYCIAFTYLDLSSSLFFGELTRYLTFQDIRAGFVKSVVFSWLIIWIGAFYGLRVRGGAEAVGKETTGSVVTGIFIIIIADALFSFIL